MTKRKPKKDHEPVGRPSKYRPEYCDLIVQVMSKGTSALGFAVQIGVSKATVYEWTNEHPEFSDAFKRAREACEHHWEKVIAVKTVSKQPGSDPLLMFWMKNRFGWSDKMSQDIKQDTNVTFVSKINDDGSVDRSQLGEEHES